MKTPLNPGPADSASPERGPRVATARSQAADWEYKVAIATASADPAPPQGQDELLVQLRKNGWLFIGGDEGIFYLKRPKRPGLQC